MGFVVIFTFNTYFIQCLDVIRVPKFIKLFIEKFNRINFIFLTVKRVDLTYNFIGRNSIKCQFEEALLCFLIEASEVLLSYM